MGSVHALWTPQMTLVATDIRSKSSEKPQEWPVRFTHQAFSCREVNIRKLDHIRWQYAIGLLPNSLYLLQCKVFPLPWPTITYINIEIPLSLSLIYAGMMPRWHEIWSFMIVAIHWDLSCLWFFLHLRYSLQNFLVVKLALVLMKAFTLYVQLSVWHLVVLSFRLSTLTYLSSKFFITRNSLSSSLMSPVIEVLPESEVNLPWSSVKDVFNHDRLIFGVFYNGIIQGARKESRLLEDNFRWLVGYQEGSLCLLTHQRHHMVTQICTTSLITKYTPLSCWQHIFPLFQHGEGWKFDWWA